MRTLAFETSGSTGSVAALEGDRVVAETELGTVQRTAQSLAPALRSTLREVKWEPCEVQLVAVSAGPGSFTGLRAGITTAKVFAYATGADIIALNTLEILASQADVASDKLWVVMDAQRQQLFVARFELTGDAGPQPDVATRILADDAWLACLGRGDYVTGPGLAKLAKRLPGEVRVVAEAAWTPQAATLGRVAIASYRSGMRSDLWKLAPQYFRKSAAEEKLQLGLLK